MSYSKYKGSQSPAKGVLYFSQYATNFVKPYDATEKFPSLETVKLRVKPYNCELLVRPKIAISELSAAISPPLQHLSELSPSLLDMDKFEKMRKVMAPLEKALEPLNSKNNLSPTNDDIKEMLRNLAQPNEKMDRAMEEMFIVASNLYTTSINYIVARSLFRDTEFYASKMNIHDGSDKDFQKTKTVKSLKSFLSAACVPSVQSKKQDKRPFVLDLDTTDEDVEDDASTSIQDKVLPKNRAKVAKTTKGQENLDTSDEESVEADAAPSAPAAKKVKKNKIQKVNSPPPPLPESLITPAPKRRQKKKKKTIT